MDNGPISVSNPDKSLIGAASKDISFSTRFPFHKLDSTNINSFEVITVFLSADTPNPASPPGGSASNRTLVYSYPHGYTYTPSTWFLLSTDNFQNVKGSEGSWIIGVASGVSPAVAKFEIDVDDKNVNFYVSKFWLNNGSLAPSVLGMFVTVRSYIFVEDLFGNSVPSQP